MEHCHFAERYATAADTAADHAETSARQAKASATTARAASDRAAHDSAAAAESAAQADFSAAYARTSAYQAREAADDAKADALAAGKSSDQAGKEAAAAWKDVVEKREAEEAEARRIAAEKRKQAAEKRKQEQESKPKCYIPVNRDSLPPCALAGQELVFPTIDPQMKEFAWEILGLNDAKDCYKNPTLGKCSLAAMSFLPIGKLKLLKKAEEGVEAVVAGSRVSKIDKASKIAFEAAKTPSKIFVKNKHLSSSVGKWAKFDSDSIPQIQSWVAEALKSKNATFLPNGETSFKMIVDLGRPIGTKGETGIRIMVGEDGVVFNCFPEKIR
ncbi:hypothetical protein [Streptomyces sp. NPDC059168]|uniref:hypothetical protein n=1 Tax=Streptomyces sp. NPDC059168 TaxID=3346753 RepID=UPI0036866CBB